MTVAPFTSDLATGGDSLTEDLNIYYEVRGTTSASLDLASRLTR